jgi:hypothetical protein
MVLVAMGSWDKKGRARPKYCLFDPLQPVILADILV